MGPGGSTWQLVDHEQEASRMHQREGHGGALGMGCLRQVGPQGGATATHAHPSYPGRPWVALRLILCSDAPHALGCALRPRPAPGMWHLQLGHGRAHLLHLHLHLQNPRLVQTGAPPGTTQGSRNRGAGGSQTCAACSMRPSHMCSMLYEAMPHVQHVL